MFSRLTRRVSSVASVRGRCASTVAHVRTATWNQAPVWAAAGLAATAALFVSVDRRERAYAMELPDCVLPNALTEDQDPLNLSEDIKELQRHFAGASQEAFVFVKPAACNKKVVDMVRERFLRLGMRVSLQGLINAEEIDRKMLIDNHYGAIAAKAVKLKPSELNVPAKGKAAFQKAFGLSWGEALAQGKVFNAADACKELGIDAAELDARWAKLTRGENLLKFGGGFYCGKIGDIFVMNGFYMQMRSAYTTPGARIAFFVIRWHTDRLSWEDFRNKILGATDPTTAEEGSLRRAILENYRELGIESEPNVGDNGLHASASPLEGLAERMNWLHREVELDEFGRGLLACGVPHKTIVEWTKDPQVTYEGETGSLFDLLEDKDSDKVLEMVTKIE